MFERFLTDALTKNFGHIIENLDADKVRLSTWNGEIHLEDVKLRRDAFDHFIKDCPVEIAYGRVGNLTLIIPWKLVRSQMWRSQINKEDAQRGVKRSDSHISITIQYLLHSAEILTINQPKSG